MVRQGQGGGDWQRLRPIRHGGRVAWCARRHGCLMGAYILRRILLMIPTLFGIMAISFAVIQFAPGGPVEQVIAKLTGQGGDATTASRGGGGDGRAAATLRRGRRDLVEISRRAGARPRIHRQAGKAVRLRQAAARALRPDAVELCPLRFRRELFPRHLGARPDPREDAGVDLARPVDHAALLPDLDPARHPQGGQGRLGLRRLDQRRRHRRLRHSRLPVRHPADGAVCRRLVLRLVPAARPDLGQFRPAFAGRRRSSTISGTWPCR